MLGVSDPVRVSVLFGWNHGQLKYVRVGKMGL
jgi:hypothetical protein